MFREVLYRLQFINYHLRGIYILGGIVCFAAGIAGAVVGSPLVIPLIGGFLGAYVGWLIAKDHPEWDVYLWRINH